VYTEKAEQVASLLALAQTRINSSKLIEARAETLISMGFKLYELSFEHSRHFSWSGRDITLLSKESADFLARDYLIKTAVAMAVADGSQGANHILLCHTHQ